MSSLRSRIALTVALAAAGGLCVYVLIGSMSETGTANAAVSQRVREGLASFFGPQSALPVDAVPVREEGESLLVAVDLPSTFLQRTDDTGQSTNRWFSALVRPEGRTRLRIDHATLPAAAQLTPAAAAALDAATQGSARRQITAEPILNMRARHRSITGLYDGDPGRDSRFEFRAEGIELNARNFSRWSDRHIAVDRLTGLSRYRRTANGAADIGLELTIDSYASVAENPVLGPLQLAAHRIVTNAEIDGVRSAELVTILRALLNGASDPASRHAHLRALLPSSLGPIGSFKLDETLEGLDIRGQALTAFADHLHFATGADATAGKIQVYLEIALGGMRFPDLTEQYSAYVPRSVTIRSTLSNIDQDAAARLLGAAPTMDVNLTAAGMPPGRLTGFEGARLRFEYFDADFGFATVTASLDATVIGPDSIRGQADIAVTGLQELMTRVQAEPNATRLLGILAVLRGFGKAEHDQTVWHIVFGEGRKISVNGFDLNRLRGK